MAYLGYDAHSAFGSVSLADRCADIMHRAFLDSEIVVTGSHVSMQTDTATIDVAGERKGVPEGGLYARNVAVQCRFQNGILSDFHWTQGPVRP